MAAASETRQTTNGSVTSFTFVTDRPKIVDGGTVKNAQRYTETLAEYHRVTVFNGLGQKVGWHKGKGDLIEVQGCIQCSKRTDSNQIERSSAAITAGEVLFR